MFMPPAILFEFTFYFMKRTYSNPDLEKFHYNKFNANDRKDWLNKFGCLCHPQYYQGQLAIRH
jgi:hypothetical protein